MPGQIQHVVVASTAKYTAARKQARQRSGRTRFAVDRRQRKGLCTLIWGYDPVGGRRVKQEIHLLTSGELNQQGLDWIECPDHTDETIAGVLRYRERARHIDLFHIVGVGDPEGVGIYVPCRGREQGPLPAEKFIGSLYHWNKSERVRGAVLNSCKSVEGARIAAEKWGFGIGTKDEVEASSAVFFAKSFYLELAGQESLNFRAAFKDAISFMKGHMDPQINDDSNLYQMFPAEVPDAE